MRYELARLLDDQFQIAGFGVGLVTRVRFNTVEEPVPPAAPEIPAAEAPLQPAETAEAEPVAEIPFAEKWVSSGHADASAEAFRHWDEDDTAVKERRPATKKLAMLNETLDVLARKDLPI